MYNILFTASVYKSSENALRFVKSIKHIAGNHVCVLVSPLQTDILKIVADLRDTENLGCRIVIFLSDVNNLYQGRGWGFVWCVANDITANYLCSGDDDIEFNENSYDIVERLNAVKFSVMTFKSEGHDYFHKAGAVEGGIREDLKWMNGDTMFTHFEDNLKYGVADALLDYPVSYYTEIEYQQRMSYLTGEWLMVDIEREFYVHHFRKSGEITTLRQSHAGPGMTTGRQLWKEKYGITLNDVHIDCEKLYRQVSEMPEKMKSHFIFYGLWNDWPAIYECLSPQFHLALDTGDI